jgi:hypothetical protein
VEGSCEHCNETSGSIKCSFSRRAQLHEVSQFILRSDGVSVHVRVALCVQGLYPSMPRPGFKLAIPLCKP